MRGTLIASLEYTEERSEHGERNPTVNEARGQNYRTPNEYESRHPNSGADSSGDHVRGDFKNRIALSQSDPHILYVWVTARASCYVPINNTSSAIE